MTMPAKAVFWLTDGSVINVRPDEYRAVLDRRGDWEPPQRVWEILVGGMVVKRLWPEQILKWDLVE